MNKPFVSIIIPVFNDAERLDICLRALDRQTWPRDSYEVIVVDNGSDEEIGPITSRYALTKCAYEERKGSYAARNKGIGLARGDIIGFTDSDCIPEQDWIEKGVATLQSTPHCGLVAGRVELFYRDPERLTAVELYERVRGFPQEEYVEKYRFGATANVFTFRTVLECVGNFDPDLRSGGDREWGNRVSASGYQLAFGEDAVISHPARSSWREIELKTRRVTLDVRDRGWPGVAKSFARLMIPPTEMIGNSWKSGHTKGLKDKMRFLFVVLYIRAIVISQRAKLLFGAEAKR